jgi:DNA-binding NarL/FixJ family response regulator
MKHRLVIAEDHVLLREGLGAMLSMRPEYEVVAKVADGREVVRAAATLRPDAILMNLSLKGLSGVEATQQIKRRTPGVRVLGMAGFKNEEHIRAALRAGVDGYVLADTSFDDLIVALTNVLSGRKFLSSEAATELVSTMLDGATRNPAKSPWDILTSRERSILKLVAEGHTNRAAAEFLSVSPKTVEKHRANLMRKLQLRNATELVLLAVDMGLVARPDINRLRAASQAEDHGAANDPTELSGRGPAMPFSAMDPAFG